MALPARSDHWDLDHPFERMLIDTAVAPDAKEFAWINPKMKPGERRKVVTGIPGETGIVYTLDRAPGKFLWARPTIMQNVIKGIDGAHRRRHREPGGDILQAGGVEDDLPRRARGQELASQRAYNPRTNVMYMPMQNLCGNFTTHDRQARSVEGLRTRVPDDHRAGHGQGRRGLGDLGRDRQDLVEVRATCRRVSRWWPTGGGLVFGGDANGRFRAFDERTGKVLWETNLGAPVSGYPITFSVDGKQYVSVAVGSSGVANATLRVTPELHPSTTGQVFVFALP